MKLMFAIILCLGMLACSAADRQKPINFHEEVDLARLSSPRKTWLSLIELTDIYNNKIQEEGYTLENVDDLDDLEEQIERLFDVRGVPEARRRTAAVEAAVYLREIIAHIPAYDANKLPDRIDAFKQMKEGYPPMWQIEDSDIVIDYIDKGTFAGNFQFSERTLKLARGMYRVVIDLPYTDPTVKGFHDAYFMTPGPLIPSDWIRDLPEWMHIDFLDQQVWQWTLMIVGFLLLLLVLYVLQVLLLRISRHWSETWRQTLNILVPICALYLTNYLEIFIEDQIFITGDVMQCVRFLSAIIWLVAFIAIILFVANLVIAQVVSRLGGVASKMSVDMQLARFAIRIGSILLSFIVIIQGLSRMGVPLATVLTGAGVTGLAIALAAQESLRNIFGSMMLLLDKPFQVGQRVKVRGHDGTIEEIGLRSTKIRLLNGHVTSIPNDDVAKADIENIGERPYIRRVMNVTITYDTPPEKIDEAIEIIEDILAVKEKDGEQFNLCVNKEGFEPRVAFNELNSDSLNIIVIYWYFPPAYWDYMAHAAYVNRSLIKRFNDAGIDFAFPTQTLHLAGDPQRPLEVDTREITPDQFRAKQAEQMAAAFATAMSVAQATPPKPSSQTGKGTATENAPLEDDLDDPSR